MSQIENAAWQALIDELEHKLRECRISRQREHDIRCVLAGEKEELDRVQGVLVGALKAAEQSLRYLGGTLHADRCRDAIAAVQKPATCEKCNSPDLCKEYGRACEHGEPTASAFPERDPSKPAEQQGIFRKFIVRRVDGSDAPGGKHHGCRYFVLDLDHDAHAPAAMLAYSADCASTHPQLSREIAWLSVAWNWARSRGITDKPNPCEGVRRNKETGRDIYVEDDELSALMDVADVPLREFLELAHLIGQRPTDMRRIHDAMQGADVLPLQQGKTKAKLRFVIEGDLEDLVNRIAARKATITKPLANTLLVDEDGQPFGKAQLRYRFAKARRLAAEKYPHLASRMAIIQVRDIRAKAGTDKREAEGLDAAQGLLGHKRADMTEHYTRQRKGKTVHPVAGIAERSAKSKKANP